MLLNKKINIALPQILSNKYPKQSKGVKKFKVKINNLKSKISNKLIFRQKTNLAANFPNNSVSIQ
jgi:hypothetical protein